MLGKLPFVLGYGVYCQNGGSEKIFFQFLTSCKKCLDAGKALFPGQPEFMMKYLGDNGDKCPTHLPRIPDFYLTSF